MEVVFENKYTRDKEWAKDIIGFISFRRPIHIVIYVLSFICLGLAIFNLIFNNTISIVYFFIPTIWAALLFYIYFKNLNYTLKRDLEIHKKPIDVEVRITEEKIIQSQSTGSEFTLDYEDIKKIVKTKKFIYLWSKTNMLYSLKNDGFTVGSADAFITFLNEKGLKCK